jgi:hypothetical protein
MRRPGMQSLVRDEVRNHISKGDWAQMEFRMGYAIQRQYDLKRDAACPASATLERAAASVQRRYPGFEPTYDEEYFGRRKKQ